MNNGDELILSNKLEYKPGPEPVVENIMTIEEIKARIDTAYGDPEPIILPYFSTMVTNKDNDSSVLNDFFALHAINRIQTLATKAWDDFASFGPNVTNEELDSFVESFKQDTKVKEARFLIKVLKSRSKAIRIISGNLTVYWNKTVSKRINLIKTKKTKHGKSKLIKFKTTVRSRPDEPIGEITF